MKRGLPPRIGIVGHSPPRQAASYDRALFTEKRDSVFELALDLAEHGAKRAA